MTSSPVVQNGDGDGDGEGEQSPKRTSDFSIDHILNRAGSNLTNNSLYTCNNYEYQRVQQPSYYDDFDIAQNSVPFTWLQCTRYCPPKVPRRKEGPQKRQLGRHPRIPFTSQQLAILEEKFRLSPYLSSSEVTTISRALHLADIRVKIWFQNRRARERREKQLSENTSNLNCNQIRNENSIDDKQNN